MVGRRLLTVAPLVGEVIVVVTAEPEGDGLGLPVGVAEGPGDADAPGEPAGDAEGFGDAAAPPVMVTFVPLLANKTFRVGSSNEEISDCEPISISVGVVVG